ncbi:hypothetical protein DACRYDRAFT_109800 [Dacryopinax primogenitus]|uniref:Uncharacterized protein n=1 Tax=Dacryopinax primogenitus (strain DJM 731) TaxID=1858805 RepID=M5FVS8_DACPD|nr:uncharacterized protein DACRYDRAFT_109800 [Dacryopinax primogenitus]EJT99694.1 hypothetical protein DACRYDRAFT_109800 [Dacryopinax primogenitus]
MSLLESPHRSMPDRPTRTSSPSRTQANDSSLDNLWDSDESIIFTKGGAENFFRPPPAPAAVPAPAPAPTAPDRIWFQTRLVAQVCLIPLALLSGISLILALVSLPLTAHTSMQVIEAANFVVTLPITLWVTLQYASSPQMFVRADRAILLPHAILTTTLPCPALPACEMTLGGTCPLSELEIYNTRLVCQVNWGIYGTGLGRLALEVSILLPLLICIYPVLHNSQLWQTSIYSIPIQGIGHLFKWGGWFTRPITEKETQKGDELVLQVMELGRDSKGTEQPRVGFMLRQADA